MLKVEAFFDHDTFTMTYIVYDSLTKDALVIDPVWDYDPASSQLTDHSVQNIKGFLRQYDLYLHYILETHAHADHVSGAQELKKYFPYAKLGIGECIKSVQSTFKKVFNLSDDDVLHSHFDQFLKDGESIQVGSFTVKVMATPGHTPACVTYEIGEYLFTGDVLFLPDSGTGRCDFPQGSAGDLYKSITQKIYQRPEHFKIMVGHDYQPGGRELKWQTTVGESKRSNILLKDGISEQEFIVARQQRDQSLKAPRLLLPSVQMNICGGRLPKIESNGQSYLKIPVTS